MLLLRLPIIALPLIFAGWATGQIVELTPTVTEGEEQFGDDLAADGDFMVVGAPNNHLTFDFSGRAAVYQFNGTDWVFFQTLSPPVPQADMKFGASVDIKGDLIIIGAFLAEGEGRAYIYRFDGIIWNFEYVVVPGDIASSDQLGTDVAIDSTIAVIGSPGNGSTGSTYIYEFDGLSWSQTEQLVDPSGLGSRFGTSVSINQMRVVIGARNNSSHTAGAGTAYVFEKNAGIWGFVTELIPSVSVNNDNYGIDVDCESNRIIVGADGQSESTNVFIFKFNGAAWIQEQQLESCEVSLGASRFGRTIDLSGNRILVGAEGETGIELGNSGVAVLFEFDGLEWVATDKFLTTDLVDVNLFSAATALIGDSAILGAPARSTHGAVFIFNDLSTTQYFDDDCDQDGVLNRCQLRRGELVDCNNNFIADVCEIADGTFGDCNDNGVIDDCENTDYRMDNWKALADLAFSVDWDIILLNQFTVLAGAETLTSISIVPDEEFPAGIPLTFLIYNDPNQDGDPSDAVLIASFAATSEVQVPGFVRRISIPPTPIGVPGDSFFVGVYASVPMFNAMVRRDSGTTLNRSWWIDSPYGTADILDLTNNSRPPTLLQDLCCPGNFMIRADMTHINGLAAGCTVPGDTNGDGVVNVTDLLTLLGGWGSCPGPCPADFNGDGNVNVSDLLTLLANWG